MRADRVADCVLLSGSAWAPASSSAVPGLRLHGARESEGRQGQRRNRARGKAAKDLQHSSPSIGGAVSEPHGPAAGCCQSAASGARRPAAGEGQVAHQVRAAVAVVEAVAADQAVVAVVAPETVVAIVAEEAVVAGFAADAVVAPAARDLIVAVVGADEVVAVPAQIRSFR
jgi:hypothetical protein